MYKKLDIQISILIRLCYLVYLSKSHPLIFLIMILVYFLIPIKDMFLYTKVKVNTNYQPYDNLLYKIPFVGIHVLKSFLPNDFCKIKQYVKSYQKLQSQFLYIKHLLLFKTIILLTLNFICQQTLDQLKSLTQARQLILLGGSNLPEKIFCGLDQFKKSKRAAQF